MNKDEKLGDLLREMGKVAIAFSGGVASSFLLKRAEEELGKENVLAVIVTSELYPQKDFEGAVRLAKDLGVLVQRVSMRELDDDHIVQNTPQSWYYSKKMLYNAIKDTADAFHITHISDGMIKDDEDDFRPGSRARAAAGVRSLLQESGWYKREIREASRERELPVWDKPGSGSLASRIPYGTPLSLGKIEQVDKAERFIRQLGFKIVRVRHHGEVARIEVRPVEILSLLQQKDQVLMKLRSLGFAYISIDLEGYRTGSMNEVLEETEPMHVG
ncbi:ATP-dependent sacrificial sulfur transferase LarE [Salimicrobium sp. PL1-032A]|uniref:ATP-dependent sacrificial sulfur transferase LarE n=1 Tax=Salimicrobium sp. PL1-032A TaxID=3095364 RepID=UPI0032601CB9